MKNIMSGIDVVKKFHNEHDLISPAEMIYAVLFAVMTVISRHTSYSDDIESNILTVNVSGFILGDIPLFIAVCCITYIVLRLIPVGIKGSYPLLVYSHDNSRSGKLSAMSAGKKAGRDRVLRRIIIFAVIMICYIPYLMSYWPGGIYNDTSYTIDIALGKAPMSDQNTVLYALFWRLIFYIGQIFHQGDYGGLKLMTVIQCMAIAAVAAFFIAWLHDRGVRVWVEILLTALAALCPIFPYYGISLWKETWFGLIFFLYTWMWYGYISGICSEHESDHDAGGNAAVATGRPKRIRALITYVMLTMLVIFSRNNGIYVIIFTMVISAVLLRKLLNRKEWKKLLVVNIIILGTVMLIKGPVYKAAGVEKSAASENYGIPLQQTAYMISTAALKTDSTDRSGNEGMIEEKSNDIIGGIDETVKNGLGMTDAEYSVITSIMPIDAWINLYNPVVVDSIKFGEYFNKGYFDTHIGDFLKVYAGMMIRNPVPAVRGYLISTMGFWDAYKSSSSAYICTAHTVQAEYFMSDYFNMKTDIYLSDIVGPRRYMSGGALVWIMLALFAVSIGRTEVLTYIPSIGLWLTYMLATPLSFSFRYLFGLFLCMPLYLCPVLAGADKNRLYAI